jgi:hypothetical protein
MFRTGTAEVMRLLLRSKTYSRYIWEEFWDRMSLMRFELRSS